jgi:16S rRNA (cytosine967-C5)-methyltransferase
MPGAAGFANAVMRRISERDLDAWLAEVAPKLDVDPVGHLALVHSHPEWTVRAFLDALGGDLAETAEALAADNERPLVHLCARPGRIATAELAEQAGGLAGAYSPYAVYLPEGAPGDLPAVARGLAHVQDEGSQLVAVATAGADVSGRDEVWLDLCAGPGGKAALLGSLAAQRGARVTAVEVAPHRARLVQQAVVGLPVDVVTADGREVGSHEALPEGGFDRVLVDAPCTGLGSLRRRPESRWRRQPSDLPPLTRLQRELLTAALRAVRPGGVVAYAVCSPHVVETKVSVAEVARRIGSTVEQVDARGALPDNLPDLGAGPAVQLWPHRHGTDAMFLALLTPSRSRRS